MRKRRVEHHLALDVNALLRRGFLKPGTAGDWTWREAPDFALRVSVARDGEAIMVGFTDAEEAEKSSRAWFLCPQPGCGRCVAKLYRLGGWSCRLCGDLAYESQLQSSPRREVIRAQRIRASLGGKRSMLAPFPEKPPTMRWATYERIRTQALNAERAFRASLRSELSSLERRLASLGAGHSPKALRRV